MCSVTIIIITHMYLKCASHGPKKGEETRERVGRGLLPPDQVAKDVLAREMCKLHTFLAIKLRAGINKQLANCGLA